MAAQELAIPGVVSDPDVRGGTPIVAGTTLRVSDLAAYHTVGGLAPEELAAEFDLDLARVHAALSYYYQNKVALDAEIRSNSEQAEALFERLRSQGRGLRLRL